MTCGCGSSIGVGFIWSLWKRCAQRTHLPCFSWTVTVPVMSSPLVYTLQMLRVAPYFTSAVGLPGGGSRAMVMSQEDEKMSEAASLAMATASDKMENILFQSPLTQDLAGASWWLCAQPHYSTQFFPLSPISSPCSSTQERRVQIRISCLGVHWTENRSRKGKQTLSRWIQPHPRASAT